MALVKRTRFILIQSTTNSNVNEDNMEPYHISVFRRATSMPPLPRMSLLNSLRRTDQTPSSSSVIPRYHQSRKRDNSTNRFNKLNIHAMKRKSARIGMRLSSVLGLSAQTIDHEFNYQEQRFRSIDKFLKLFLRNTYTSLDSLRETFMNQVNIGEDFEELLIDKIPDLPQQFVRSQRALLENAFIEFCSHIEAYVIEPINNLIKLFVFPSNLISKRNKKLLDFDSAQSAYDKVKDQQLTQAKQILDHTKETYEHLNNQLVEQLPILYDTAYQILSISLKEYLRAHCCFMHQTRVHFQMILNLQDLNWQDILDRFTKKISSSDEQLLQLTITAKNFAEKSKHMSINVYNYDKEIYGQTDEIRNLLKARYSDKELCVVNRDYSVNNDNRRVDLTVRCGDLVGILSETNENIDPSNCFVDTGVTRGYLPRSILTPLISSPSTPTRQDVVQAPQPLPRKRTTTTTAATAKDSEPIYLNHEYASIEQEKIYIALYEFDSSMPGVLSLQVGDRLKVLRHLDDDGNEEWWYVEKLDQTQAKGYVPANYIQPT